MYLLSHLTESLPYSLGGTIAHRGGFSAVGKKETVPWMIFLSRLARQLSLDTPVVTSPL